MVHPRMDDEVVKTYRYVRIGLIAAVALLFIALTLQIGAAGWGEQKSISAFYYTPVRPVFVGVLVGAAFALVAIRGRRGGEDALLDLAGMLMPIVAFIPTPAPGTQDEPCPVPAGQIPPDDPADVRCIPQEFVPDVELSMSALILLGVLGLAFAGWTLTKTKQDRAARLGFTAACGVWLLFALLHGPTSSWPPRDWLLSFGHYLAAVPMFGLMVVVALINARKSRRSIRVASTDVSYRVIYLTVAWAMSVVITAGILVWFFFLRDNESPPAFPLIFWIEFLLLGLFAVFWAAQTKEFYYEGLPEGAREPDVAPWNA